MTRPQQLGIAAYAVLAVYVYGNCMRAAGARDARSDIAADSLDTEVVNLDSLRAAIDSAWLGQISSLEADVTKNRKQALQATRRADSLASLLPESPRVDSVLAAKDSALNLWKAVAESERIRGDMLLNEIAARDSLIGKYREALGAALNQRDQYRERAKPGLLENVRRGLPWILVGAVAWEFARE